MIIPRALDAAITLIEAPRSDELIPGRDEWQAECEMAVVHLSNLLWAAGRRITSAAILEMLRQLPHGDAEVAVDEATDGGLYARCMREGIGNAFGWKDGEQLALRKFLKRVAAMSTARRGLLEASVSGSLLGYGMSR